VSFIKQLEMKSLSINKPLTLLLLLVALVTSSKVAAENKLYIEDFTVSTYDAVQVPVVLENSDAVAALQFSVEVPEGFLMESAPSKSDRFASSQVISYQQNTATKYTVVVASFQKQNFTGNDGAVLYLNLRADETSGVLLRNGSAELNLSNIVLSNGDGSQSWRPDDSTTTITLMAATFKVTANEEAVVVTPGKPFEVKVGLDASTDAAGMQFDVKMPEGFSVDTESVVAGQRCGASTVTTTVNEGFVRFLVFNMAGGNAIENTTGEVVTFKVNTPADFADATAEMSVYNAQVSALGDQTFLAGEAKVSLVNAKTAYAEALAKVAELRQSLADALATIAEAAPDVKDQFTGDDIATSINNLESAINSAYDDESLNSNYETVMAPVSEIEAAIAKLIEDAKAAQAQKEADDAAAAAQAALDAAKEKADAEVKALEEALAAALETIATDAPDVKDQFTGDEISTDIEALKTAIANAYADGSLTDDYDTVMNPKDGISAAIAKLIEDAKAAQAQKEADDAAAAQAALDAAKANADAVVKDLEDALAAALATIAENAADVKDDFTGSEISADIDALKTAIANAYADGSLTDNYETVMANSSDIADDIDDLVTDALAAQAAFEEQARQDRNKAAYEADLATLDALTKELEEAIAALKEEYPYYDYSTEESNIRTSIYVTKVACQSAYAAVATSGEYSSPVDAQAIRDMIEAMKNNAAQTGVEMIMADVQKGDARIFTPSGMQVARPIQGQLNIIVYNSGHIQKIFVK
jgi:hypothetical protein